MARIKVFLDVFTKVTTCILLGAATYCSFFFYDGMFSRHLLWELLLVSFLTSLGVLFYTDDLNKKSMRLVCILHYLFNNVVVVGCGLWFGWIDAKGFCSCINYADVLCNISISRECNYGYCVHNRRSKS